MGKRIIFITLVIVFGIGAYFTYNLKFIRTGTIVEIRKDAIVVRGDGRYEPDYVFPIEEKSRFYDSQGNEITLSGLKAGDHVKIKLYPRSYGGIFLARKQKTIRWVKVLSEK